MTPNFTQWLKDTFLSADHLQRPARSEHHHADCAGAPGCYESILSVVDGDITPEDEERFKRVMTVCSPCYEELDVQMAIREAVKAKVTEKEVPAGILDKIRSKIGVTA